MTLGDDDNHLLKWQTQTNNCNEIYCRLYDSNEDRYEYYETNDKYEDILFFRLT